MRSGAGGRGAPRRAKLGGVGDAGDRHDPALRVSDADRDRVAAALREHCGAGRLTLDELSERVEAALAARTRADLDRVLVDLPALPPEGAEPAPAAGAGAGRRPSTSWTVSVLGSSSRRGRWRPRLLTNVVAVLGSCDVDLRQAEVEGPELVITAVAVLGSVEVTVPEGIEVDMSGVPVLGSKELHVSDAPALAGAPRIRVRAFPVLGSVEVRSRRSGRPAVGAGRPLRRGW